MTRRSDPQDPSRRWTHDSLIGPPAVRALVSDLIASGFAVGTDTGTSSVNRLLELTGPGCGVRITADRGEWWVELGRPPEIGWYDAGVWSACLDDRPVVGEAAPLDEQVEIVLRRWSEVAVAAAGIDDCLARTRQRRARERLGLPPVLG